MFISVNAKTEFSVFCAGKPDAPMLAHGDNCFNSAAGAPGEDRVRHPHSL
jgi:hypothetical protein